ncbi:MAG: ergothioneine biosynthesis protein EgtB [Acidobacteria bacterium]|nr:ergothioneine biosynthesis protein EgtB [Acidobacteriota bacterium]
MQPAERLVDPIEGLADFYRRIRAYTEHLCEPLEIEDYIPQPIVDVSPPRWNIAHTTWFFEEMILKKFVPDYEVFDEDFGFLFNSYYNSIGTRTLRDHRGDLSRPTVKEVFAYRKYVDEQMVRLLSEPGAVATGSTELSELVTLGLNHEQQHQELFLTDLKYAFSLNPLFPAYLEGYAPEENPCGGYPALIPIAGGVHEIGHTGDGFCFDNELARHKVYFDDFGISDCLVTNQDFLEFIEAGGYQDHRLWHAEGWDWVNQNDIVAPLYWHTRDNEHMHFALGGLRPLPLAAPVCHVSWYEASAFAEWKGMRLPTEFEWEVASRKFDWGKRWEWTSSAYLPYPGFTRAPGAVGEYNGKFMVNQMVLRGASVATPAGHSRSTYRNFFQPHLRWQFTGVRLAK